MMKEMVDGNDIAFGFRERYRMVCDAMQVVPLKTMLDRLGAEISQMDGNGAVRPGSPLSFALSECVRGGDAGLDNNDRLQLIYVNLNGCNGIDKEQISVLVASCFDEKGVTDLQLSLDLEGCRLGPAEAHAIGKSVACGVVRELYLRSSFSNEGEQQVDEDRMDSLSCFCSALRYNKTRAPKTDSARPLVKLDLGLVDLSAEIRFSQVGAAFQWLRALQSLNLESCELGDAGTTAVCEALLTHQVVTLRALYLSRNGCGQSGVGSVARLLKAVPLQELDLANNSINDAGLQTLTGAVQEGNSLRCLDISGNDVGYLSALRELFEFLIGKECRLAKLSLCGLCGIVDDRVVEILGTTLAVNDSLIFVDLRAAVPLTISSYSTASKDAVAFLAESLNSNTKITNIQLSMAPGDEPLMAPIFHILGLNHKLSMVIKQRESKKQIVDGAMKQSKAKHVVHHPSLAPISPKVKGAIAKWKENASDTTFGWGNDDDEEDEAEAVFQCEQQMMNEKQDSIRKPVHSVFSRRLAVRIEELRRSLRAARSRAETNCFLFEEDFFGKVLSVEGRLDAVVENKEQELGNIGSGYLNTKSKHAERVKRHVSARIARLEDRMKNAFHVTEALANVSRNVSVELKDMDRLLSEEQELENGLLRHTDGEAIANIVSTTFERCKENIEVLEATHMHDHSVSDSHWREKFERGLSVLDERVKLLAKCVISVHKENIRSLEIVLQQCQQPYATIVSTSSEKSKKVKNRKH